MYNSIDRKLFNNEAMRSGTLLGLLWIASYTVALGNITNPIYALLFSAMNIASPFYAGYLAISFRKKHCDNSLRYIQAWYFLLIEYLCASLLTAMAMFIYLHFIDSAALSNFMNKILDTLRAEPQIYSAMSGDIEQMSTIYANMSTRDIVLNFATSNLMNGSILAPIIALFVKRNPK